MSSELIKSQLAKKIIEKESFIVLFFSKFCDMCEKEKIILDYHLTNYFSICVDGDEDFFINHYSLDVMPELRVYKNGEIVWRKFNIIQPEEVSIIKQYESDIK